MPERVPTVVDVVILSYTKTQELYEMTLRGIKSLNESETDYTFNIVLVETDREHQWAWPDNVTMVHCNLPFIYNQALNKGICQLGEADQVVIANNDVLFTPGWFTHIAAAMKEHSLDSASPLTLDWQPHSDYDESTVHIGFRTSYQFCGWCLVLNREALETVIPLDEQFAFEFQDNDLAKQLEQLGYRHALVGRSQVVHLLNRSHHLLTEDERTRMITKAREVFDAKYK
jgi:hypothetical protein